MKRDDDQHTVEWLAPMSTLSSISRAKWNTTTHTFERHFPTSTNQILLLYEAKEEHMNDQNFLERLSPTSAIDESTHIAQNRRAQGSSELAGAIVSNQHDLKYLCSASQQRVCT